MYTGMFGSEKDRPINPLLLSTLHIPESELIKLLRQWAFIRDSVWYSTRDVIRHSTRGRDTTRDALWFSVKFSIIESEEIEYIGRKKWRDVESSIFTFIWDPVRCVINASVGSDKEDAVRDSVRDAIWAYIGGLFPEIITWKYAEKLGPDPWRPLLTLWYSGYVPSFDGQTWRLHVGEKAEIYKSWENLD